VVERRSLHLGPASPLLVAPRHQKSPSIGFSGLRPQGALSLPGWQTQSRLTQMVTEVGTTATDSLPPAPSAGPTPRPEPVSRWTQSARHSVWLGRMSHPAIAIEAAMPARRSAARPEGRERGPDRASPRIRINHAISTLPGTGTTAT
jgi:hypothetical protein